MNIYGFSKRLASANYHVAQRLHPDNTMLASALLYLPAEYFLQIRRLELLSLRKLRLAQVFAAMPLHLLVIAYYIGTPTCPSTVLVMILKAICRVIYEKLK